MPIPLIATLGTAGGATAASTALGVGQGILGAFQNRANKRHAIKMMDKQREWALADWNMQNEYNSPRAQMQRLQEAGLNPNLVYGQGVQGATGNSGNVRSSDSGQWRGETPNIMGLQDSIFAGINLEQRKAQVDLLEKQATIAVQTAALQAAKTGETLAKTAKSQFDLQMANSLKNTSLQTAEENLRKLQIGNQFQLDENERRQALTASNLQQAAERILLSRSQRESNDVQRQQMREAIRNMKLDGSLKQLDIDLKEKGIQPTDALWQRVLGRIIEKYSSGDYEGHFDSKTLDSLKANDIRYYQNKTKKW